MNSHEEIRRNLPAYCSGDLSPSEQAQVREHLASCPACRGELTELETVLRLLRTTPQVEPPPWLATRVMARVREQHSQRSRWLRRLFFPLQVKLPLEVAALLVVCLTGWYLTRTVETELMQGVLRTDTPEQTAPAPKSEVTQPAADIRRAAPAPVAPQQGQQGVPKQPDHLLQPGTQEAPPPPSTSPAPQPTATSAAEPHQRKEEKALPVAPPPPASLQSAPKSESADRLMDATSESPRKALKGAQRNAAESSAPAPAGQAAGKPALQTPPVLTIHLEATDPTAAPAAIREAAERSGGHITNGRALADRRLTVMIPAQRFIEFRLRLSWIGRIPPIPPVDPEPGMVEVTVSW